MSDDNISYQEYRNEIESIVDSIEDEMVEYDDDLAELVFEHVDSHQWVIYHSYSTDILDHSEPDEWKHLVGDDDDYQRVLTAMAFSAMRKDVWEEINRRGLDD